MSTGEGIYLSFCLLFLVCLREWLFYYPIPGPDGGYPILMMGVPASQVWTGVPHSRSRQYQHSEHMLRGGRYASCVHAGGLSCEFTFWGFGSTAYRIHTSETFRLAVEKVGGYQLEFRGSIQVKVSRFTMETVQADETRIHFESH